MLDDPIAGLEVDAFVKTIATVDPGIRRSLTICVDLGKDGNCIEFAGDVSANRLFDIGGGEGRFECVFAEPTFEACAGSDNCFR